MLPFDWNFPYAAQKMPLLAANAVSASQPLAAQAGLRMLYQGGNAIDSAIATAIALTVVEPVMNGIGGDMFALVWHEGQLYGLNSSGRSPAAWTAEYFKGRDKMPATGWDSGHRSRPGGRLEGAVAALRQAAVRAAVRAGHRVRATRFHGVAADCAPVGGAGAGADRRAGLSRGVHDRRPRAAAPASAGASRRRRPPCARSPTATARAFTAAHWPRRIAAFAARPAARCAPPTSPRTRRNG